MGAIETLERNPRTRMGAYFYVVFMFAAAVFKTTAGLGEPAGQDYLWRLFWIRRGHRVGGYECSTSRTGNRRAAGRCGWRVVGAC